MSYTRSMNPGAYKSLTATASAKNVLYACHCLWIFRKLADARPVYTDASISAVFTSLIGSTWKCLSSTEQSAGALALWLSACVVIRCLRLCQQRSKDGTQTVVVWVPTC